MSSSVTVAGNTYQVPAEGDSNWGTDVSSLLVALSDPSKLLQSGSSSFPLLQDLNFGSSYGLKLNYIKSQSLNPASAGFLRLGYDQNVSWRNNTNSGDLSLNLDGSDNLQFNSTKIPLSGAIVNADINASAAIDISKINNLQSSLNSLNPMTTTGDLIRGAASGTPERLAIGALGSLLRSNGTTAAWTTDFIVDSNRIQADFSNATYTNRMAFQTSTTNSPTGVSALPSGTGTFGGFAGYNNSDPTNSSYMSVYCNATEVSLSSTRRGSGTYLPLTFLTGDSERMRIDSSGNVTIATLAGTGSRAVNANASGTLSAASDSRLKQEVEAPIPGLNEILQLQPKAYKWLADIEKRGENAATEIGFFADQVANIIPSAAPLGSDGYYGFYDRSVTATLVKAIQELSVKNDEKDATIAALIARIEALENA